MTSGHFCKRSAAGDAQIYRAQGEREVTVASYCSLSQGLGLKFYCNKTAGKIEYIMLGNCFR